MVGRATEARASGAAVRDAFSLPIVGSGKQLPRGAPGAPAALHYLSPAGPCFQVLCLP